MRSFGCDNAFLFICDVCNVNFRWFLPTMKHFPFFPKITQKYTKIAHLAGIHYNAFLFLLPYHLIYCQNPSQIVNITKDYYIIFQASFFCQLCIHLIHVNFAIQSMACFNHKIGSGFFSNLIFVVNFNKNLSTISSIGVFRMYEFGVVQGDEMWIKKDKIGDKIGSNLLGKRNTFDKP